MFYKQRKRREEMEAEGAAGSSFWTGDFSGQARTKIWYAFTDAVDGTVVRSAAERVRTHVLRDEGLTRLAGHLDPIGDLGEFCTTTLDVDLVVSIVGAMLLGLLEEGLAGQHNLVRPASFRARVRKCRKTHLSTRQEAKKRCNDLCG